jgi:hypothetical protein
MTDKSKFIKDGVGVDPRSIPKEDLEVFEHKTAMKAIRAKCLDCSYNAQEVKMCTAVDCPLWPFRLGKNVFSSRKMTDEQRQAASERLKKARGNKSE